MALMKKMIKEKAYAKVNLFLNVLDKRRDGYHNLEMVNVKINLHDEIKIKKCHMTSGVIIKSNDMFLSNQDNIVLQCARFIQEKYNLNSGIEITIDKRIPYGAGLGGNSTDVASVIKGINQLENLNLSLETMQEIGIMFGADIPYCLVDYPAIVTEKGETINQFENKLSDYFILIVHPKIYVSTETIFDEGDQSGFKHADISKIIKAIKENDFALIQHSLFNSLEEIVMKKDERMSKFKTELVSELGEEGLVMTGSGSTFIKIIKQEDNKIIDFIDENKDKYFVGAYKIK
ncbi:MAG: 4-(cytidine 5'-diphospho)-2-C-methyl-D-erythritol kinase [Candidatus Izimaplasma sp.]|nr:4-(cytidine 5'-diphospho)-2-C-methyl-D-erythritol kinase [Candidatus Izimaplasma bacterium]